MDQKEKLKSFAAGFGKAAKGVLNSAIRAADQNDDGKFDLSDVSVMASAVGDTMKKGAQTIRNSADETARKYELKSLQPIFPSDLNSADFILPKFIRVAPRDKKHAESELCKGSIGYYSLHKGILLINLFQDSLDVFGISLFPDSDSTFYYIDPSNCNFYISLDEYFGYLKTSRIGELEKIAQALGAKHFRVTYKEEQTSFSRKEAKSGASVRSGTSDSGSVSSEHIASETKFSTVAVASEMDFQGHSPVRPVLKYLQHDPSIKSLIESRMNPDSPLLHKKYILKMSQSSGIRESDAVKIDAVLKSMKCSGNTTVASEAKNESRRYLEYDIEF